MLQYFNRDLSWLTFNQRVLEEAANHAAPLIERIRFLSIYSSNLDEFYRVRMPVLRALQKIGEKKSSDIDSAKQADILQQASAMILAQQQHFGEILTTQLIPLLRKEKVNLLYNQPLPQALHEDVSNYFLSEVLAFLQPFALDEKHDFFPENNKLYFLVELTEGKDDKLVLLNIPSDNLPRFFSVKAGGEQYILFLDDVIRFNLGKLFGKAEIKNCYSFKITRDAELDLKDEYSGDLSEQIEKQLNKRDLGYATRFLYQADMPLRILDSLGTYLNLNKPTAVEGGRYHNLKDLFALPVSGDKLVYQKWPAGKLADVSTEEPLADVIGKKDLLVSTPYQSYDTILRFFNEAANNPDVTEINVTLYRVASDSKIVNALISAAKNGKKVRVVVELKARFDEANNIKWAKKMMAAGVDIIYSVTALKVHAKIALVKTKKGNRIAYSGLLATGNFNEGTAKFYTDHILLTTNHKLLREVELLFIFLAKRVKPSADNHIKFKHILVAQFNLQTRFVELIDREIAFAKQSQPASIIIKMNNLEEQEMIKKLYEASQAGVKVSLIVRGICCLVPGVKGMSENITIRRIVDRFLEHPRVFIFGNNGDKEVFMGSADWMNRNIYHRIEVCFPVYDQAILAQISELIQFQLNDNVQAVFIDEHLNNTKPESDGSPVRSQEAIYRHLTNRNAV
ncbi:polyphosphate kinase 1 [Mucilaginibacter sp. ZT4R22]|uniref:Polyphosphate kinase n=1 Tax=Mucilaginibacter pankratovii TaxID=2772110 RepID=A0ABR7WIZ9_9SPHI|nr:polyphosphate kinase 1 [Mucilaginibacter pankratovii]MBD1362306.1 polyphosphate kinase 1 [Mucilaginibacter pankratovii]